LQLLFAMEPVLPRARARELLDLLARLAARGRELGGVRYLAGSIEYGSAQWRAHYGPLWADIERLKQRYDPDRVFSSTGVGF
jgi:FAD/FMN-containing dehydrogenase